MFETLSKKLSNTFKDIDGILIGNVFCNGGELDCLLLKNDSITILELKDYSGRIERGAEEGKWIIDQKKMRNPYQQLRKFKFKVLNFLNEREEDIFGIQKSKALNLGHITAVVVFRENAEYDKREHLSPTSWKWFFVSDLENIDNCINKITSDELRTNKEEWSKILDFLNVKESMRINKKYQKEAEKASKTSVNKGEMMSDQPQEDEAKFSKGENVKYVTTDNIGTINKIIKGKRGFSYKVTINGEIKTVAERFLEPYKDVEEQVIEQFSKGDFGDYDDFILFHNWLRLTKPIEGNLYSYLSSKTKFNPHQFKPLLRFLSPASDERLFIADEVGVGKTIEAGIILKELLARNRISYKSNILVVCPNSLARPKWFKEMKERFNLDFHIHDGGSLKYTLESILQDGFFPKKYNFSIVSLQLFRMEEYLNLLKKVDAAREHNLFDMVIIDEAHHLRNKDTNSFTLGKILSGLTDMMLMLSATPLNLENEDLFNQMNILNPMAFPDEDTFEELRKPVVYLNRIRKIISKRKVQKQKEKIRGLLNKLKKSSLKKTISDHPQINELLSILEEGRSLTPEESVRFEKLFVSLSPLYHSFTRTRKRVALEHQVHREVWEIPIALSEEEIQFRNEFLNSIKQYYKRKGIEAINFAINTHRRMISSCIPATKRYIDWCLNQDKVISESLDEDTFEPEDDSQLKNKPIDEELKSELSELAKKADRISKSDNKYQEFKKLIEKILANPETPQVIVFSFFVKTLEYLKEKLENEGYDVGMIHGEIPHESTEEQPGRYEIMESFKNGNFDILLSSEVGGEGLDFQYCHSMINYDLPYNPMRVEQRIGRLDRFGQTADKIIVANLFIKDTVDEEIYDRLYRRISLVEDGVGALEPILGSELSDIQSAILSGELSEEQKEKLSKRLEEQVKSAKLQSEELEKRKKELIGDDYLSKPINKITDREFVGPRDAIKLTKNFISKKENCEYTRTGEFTGRLRISETVVSDIESFLRKPGSEGGYSELQPLLTPDTEIKVIFNGTKAIDNPDHLFLPPTGFWTKFLSKELEKNNYVKKSFKYNLDFKDLDLASSKYLVFLFEVRFEGFRTEIELMGLPVNISEEKVAEVDYSNLPRELMNVDAKELDDIPSIYDPNLYRDIARNKLEEVLEDKRKKTAEENSYKVESRIAALEKSSQMKIKKLKRQIKEHKENRKEKGKEPDEDYLRMTQARIKKEKSRLETRKEKLEKKREISLNYNLEGVIYIVGDSNE